MNYLLSICIPTYNRKIWLERCVDALLTQINDNVEIIISDNCSLDDTEEYCLSIAAKYPIKYHKQEKNLGPDGNFLWLLNNCKGKYAIILADDDYMDSNSIEKLLKYLNDVNIGVGLINAKSVLGNEILPNTVYKLEGKSYFSEKEIEQMLLESGVQMTFVSGLIFNMDIVHKIENKDGYLNTNLFQTHLWVRCLQYNKSSALFRDVMVLSQAENSAGYNFYKVFIENWYQVLFKTGAEVGIAKQTLNKIYNNTIKNFICGFLIKDKINGGLSFKTDNRMKYLAKTLKFRFGWLRVLPIYLAPKWLLKKVYGG